MYPQDIETLLRKMISLGAEAGKNLLIALLIFVVGRYLIRFVKVFLTKALSRSRLDATVQSFIISFVNILLMLLLGVSVISALGVNTTSFAALLASAGVAVGMALSGNLQNFAGGIIILILHPYRAGDFIEVQGVQGTVKEIQIFHTIITTSDNKMVFLPNAMMSSSIIINFTRTGTRRAEWVVGVDYGSDLNEVQRTLAEVLAAEPRLLAQPAPYIAVNALADSSVNFVVQAWVQSSDFIPVKNAIHSAIYKRFNEQGINFPFPQQTVHLVKD